MADKNSPSAYSDTFVRDHLPPEEDQPEFKFRLPDGNSITYPPQLNAATELLDQMVEDGNELAPAIYFDDQVITYRELLDWSNRIAGVLSHDLGIQPGNRVLLRGPNNPWLAACWFAVLKAGGIVVTTLPMLRDREIGYILEKAQVSLALCDERFAADLQSAIDRSQQDVTMLLYQSDDPALSLSSKMEAQSEQFENVQTSSEDVALIAFTSGTTGQPKAPVHFHRDILAICDYYSRQILNPGPADVFCGTPPFAFTFGLGGVLLFPLRVGASTVLLERPTPDGLLSAIERHQITTLFTAPTMYRTLAPLAQDYDISSLKRCVSAGEHLPPSTFDLWLDATGLKLLDGIGATEMLHIFISNQPGKELPGSTGMVVPGYDAQIVDDEGNTMPRGSVGRLAVRGPTGCRYLDDPERQHQYVQHGWNLTGDAYMQDEAGYFWFQARTDDMIISSGYNIAGPEVENALLEHPSVSECAVVGLPDPARGNLVTAFVVMTPDTEIDDQTEVELQDFVKATIAPYKYPRKIYFLDALPRTETGKLQRYRLREQYTDRVAE